MTDTYRDRELLFKSVDSDSSLDEAERRALTNLIDAHYPTQPSDEGDFSSPASCVHDGECYPCRSVQQIMGRYGP